MFGWITVYSIFALLCFLSAVLVQEIISEHNTVAMARRGTPVHGNSHHLPVRGRPRTTIAFGLGKPQAELQAFFLRQPSCRSGSAAIDD